MSRHLTTAAPLLLALAAWACGSEAAPAPAPASAPAAEYLTGAETNPRELVATLDEAGATWLCWLDQPSEVLEGTLSVELDCLADDAPAAILFSGPALGPASLAHLAGGGVFVAWEARAETGRELFGRAVRRGPAGLELGPLESLPGDAQTPLEPNLAALADGSLGLVWQALDGPHYRAYFATRSRAGAWSTPRAVTPPQGADVWRPRLAGASDGRTLVAYDRFVPGALDGFDVLLAVAPSADADFAQTLLAGGPTYQGLPELAVEPGGRAWITYEEAPGFGQRGPLRGRRQPRLVAVEPDGRIAHAVLPLALQNGQRGDFPRLAVSASGLALTRRQPNSDFEPRNPTRRPFYATWHTLVLGFTPAGEAVEFDLADSDGDNENDGVLVAGPEGLALLLATDGRSTDFPKRFGFGVPIENAWRVARFDLGQLTGFPELEPGPAPPVAQAWSTPEPQGLALDQRNPRALIGDLHRHTDLSRCSGRQDGTLLDAVRYARGPGALDFLAITDHFQHLTPWSLGRQLRDIERYDAPGSLTLLAGIERMVPDLGHQNLIFDSLDSLRAASLELPPKDLPRGSIVAIPHMTSLLANPFDWTRLDPEVQRLVEVHQGLRGSYEGLPLDDATAGAIWPMAGLDVWASKGWLTRLPGLLEPNATPPGLISSSDHGSSGMAFAGVFLERKFAPRTLAIFDALYERKTFASTGPARSPHDLSLELVTQPSGATELVARADPSGLIAIVLFENGHPVELAPTAFDEATSARTLLVQTHFGMGSSTKLTIRPEGLTLAEPHLRHPDPDTPGARARDTDGSLQLDFAQRGAADTDLVFTATPTPGVPQALTLELDLTQAEGGVVSQRLELAGLGATDARRVFLEAEGRRPYFDVISLGAVPTENRARCWSVEGRPSGAIYYARASWADGNITWSRMLRRP